MPRFKLTIEYAGTRYSGWQIQKNARTVQGELDRARSRRRPAAREFELYGAGRTDAGVHALAQVAHLDVRTALPPGAAAAPHQRRAAGRHQRARDRQGAAPLPRAPRRGRAQLPLPDRAAAHRVRQAVRLVGQGAARRRRDAARGRARSPACSDFPAFTDDDPDEKSTTGACSSASRLDEDGRARPGPRRGLALPVEDGAADGRRARRSRPRRARPDDVARFLREPSAMPADG